MARSSCLFRLAPKQENAIAQGAQFVVKMTVGIHKCRSIQTFQ
jgi:hypothetical protein